MNIASTEYKTRSNYKKNVKTESKPEWFDKEFKEESLTDVELKEIEDILSV